MRISMPNPNYNLYRFQKISLIINNPSATPTNDINNNRISGNWFIVDIKIVFNDGKFTQEISLIKRELELSPEEMEAEDALNEEKNPTANNPIERTTNPTDLSNTDTGNISSSTQSTPVVRNDASSKSSSKNKLDLLPGSYVTNGGDKIQLCQIDGKAVNVKIADAYLTMKEDAKADNILLSIGSGFRSPYDPINAKSDAGVKVTASSQDELYKMYLAGKGNLAAKPGSSNHGNGTSLDLNTGSRRAKSNGPLNPKVYIWLVNNSYKYGFVRGVKTEEWHYDYIPTIAANGPYAKIPNTTDSRFYSDLGLDNIRIA